MTEFFLTIGLKALLHFLLARYAWLRYVVGVVLLPIGLLCGGVLILVIVNVWGIGWSAGIAGLLIAGALAYVIRCLLRHDGPG